MYQSEQVIHNQSQDDWEVMVEPWGVAYDLPAGSRLSVVARSRKEGALEVEGDPPLVTVWAWPGCTFAVYQDGKLVDDVPIGVPPTPGGMSTKAFLGMVLGQSDT